jgi:predicted GH43/DUF377 family glycosyl hydrolase
MSGTWEKKGLVFAPAGQASWIGTHAGMPAVQRLDGRERMFFASRDAQGRAQIGYFELSLDHPHEIFEVSQTPVLSPGSLGSFDDSGCTSATMVTHEGRVYAYYTGWSLGKTVPFYLNVGLAISEDGGRTFERASPAPILDRNAVDPYLTGTPSVLVEDGVWRMWYVSATTWRITPEGPRHWYHIRYAESADGINWKRDGLVCIDYKSDDEYAIARPCVLREGGIYRMWYCSRGHRYRIGYAESKDGLSWTRLDSSPDAALPVSETGWDSDMVGYPMVMRHQGALYMFYNGNDYGRTGIGLAVKRDA